MRRVAPGEGDFPALGLTARLAELTRRGERVELLLVLEPDLVVVRDDVALAASEDAPAARPAPPASRLDGASGRAESRVQIRAQGADVATSAVHELAGLFVAARLDVRADLLDRRGDRAEALLRAVPNPTERVDEREPPGSDLRIRGGALREDAQLSVLGEAPRELLSVDLAQVAIDCDEGPARDEQIAAELREPAAKGFRCSRARTSQPRSARPHFFARGRPSRRRRSRSGRLRPIAVSAAAASSRSRPAVDDGPSLRGGGNRDCRPPASTWNSSSGSGNPFRRTRPSSRMERPDSRAATSSSRVVRETST